MPKKKANTEELTKGTKKKSEYDAKVAKIKAQVKMLMPMVKTKVPELPPLIGTLGFEHLTHPFKPSANSPNLIGAKTVSGKAMAEKLEKTLQAKERKEKLVLREAKRKERLANRTSSTYDSDDDSGDDDSSLPYVKRKAAANMRFEDFVIPDVVDAETGEELLLTKSTWSADEGRANFDMQSILNRGAASVKISARPDSSHRIVPILSPRIVKKSKFKKASTKIMSAMMFKKKTTTTEDGAEEGGDEEEAAAEEAARQAAHGQGGHIDLKGVYREKVKNKLGIVSTKKQHHYDATATITDDSANFWRHTDGERVAVHHYEHLIDGFTKEEIAEKQHAASMHHLHIKFKDDAPAEEMQHIHVHHHDGEEEKEDQGTFVAAKHRMHPLVASFLKDGPQQPMYHTYWDSKYDKVLVPEGYVNDVDGDADAYIGKYVKEEHETAKAEPAAAEEQVPQSARSTTSSVGFESAESIMRDRGHPDKKRVLGASSGTQGGLSAQLEKVSKEGDGLLAEGKNLPTGHEGEMGAEQEDMSILSDALDPENEVSWRALEDRYYFEIRTHALDYEANKRWTKEKAIKGGVGGMDVACRKFANWKMRSIKFIVQATDDEEKKELGRLALEDELEINKPERLLDQAKLHNEERHRHRTYIKTFRYDIEICALKKLNEMGLVW